MSDNTVHNKNSDLVFLSSPNDAGLFYGCLCSKNTETIFFSMFFCIFFIVILYLMVKLTYMHNKHSSRFIF